MGSTTTTTAGGSAIPTPLSLSALAAMSDAELAESFDVEAALVAAHQGRQLAVVGEIERRQSYRSDGATSMGSWVAERSGVSSSTARVLAQVAKALFDLPALSDALSSGQVSLDKVRTLAPLARPESDAAWTEAAKTYSVGELCELVTSSRPPVAPDAAGEHQGRFVRFNAALRTISARLPAASFALVRTCLETRAKALGSDGQTPFDQRLADALCALVHEEGGGGGPGRSPYLVVAHTALSSLLDEESSLLGELEHGGLLSADVVRRLACEAKVVVALDDDDGHTIYEGRQSRDATATQRRELWRRDRHCRFPGCGHRLFVIAHHVRFWSPPERGPTDLDNLALLCQHHHTLIHTKSLGWRVYGDPNAELSFVGPNGRVMTTRPSPLWTRVSRQGAGGQGGTEGAPTAGGAG